MEEAVKRFDGVDTRINNGNTSGPVNVSDVTIRTEINLQQTPYSVMEEYEFVNPKTKVIYSRVKAAVKRMLSENNIKTVVQLSTYHHAKGA